METNPGTLPLTAPTAGRSVASTTHAWRTLEGAGFEVRRPFPTPTLDAFDPFLLLDHMGPMEHAPGQAQGAPDHPHRGFETVSYMLDGELEHSDSTGRSGRIGAGDVQWMTAGAGVVHAEMPSRRIQEQGGRIEGLQLWVNLPRRDKRMAPRYQEVPSARIPVGTSEDGRVRVKVIAGEALGQKAVIETRTPIFYLHFTLAPGARQVQPAPAAYNVFAYVLRGRVKVAGEEVAEGDAVFLKRDGDTVELSTEGTEGADVLLLGGIPLHEPVARYGPFVMNTRKEILEAIEDYQAGRMGQIVPKA
ncbi:pirin family protein [Myxococcaceae bacterium JPH2]|nr:pirin family protein [Myxococcaceae bacterium JPH2]